jgi:hypothetical protein
LGDVQDVVDYWRDKQKIDAPEGMDLLKEPSELITNSNQLRDNNKLKTIGEKFAELENKKPAPCPLRGMVLVISCCLLFF